MSSPARPSLSGEEWEHTPFATCHTVTMCLWLSSSSTCSTEVYLIYKGLSLQLDKPVQDIWKVQWYAYRFHCPSLLEYQDNRHSWFYCISPTRQPPKIQFTHPSSLANWQITNPNPQKDNNPFTHSYLHFKPPKEKHLC